VLERPLRYLAIILSLFVATGFVLFALEDIDRASTSSQNRIADIMSISPSPSGERDRAARHSKVHEAIDDVNDVLLDPFAGISRDADSRWVQRGVPTLIGLFVYGFLLGFAARYTKGRQPAYPPAVGRTA
jgi:hypothetical protein